MRKAILILSLFILSCETSVDKAPEVKETLTEESPINIEEKRILRSIVEFGNIQVKEIMKSRVDVTAFSVDASFEDIKKI